MERFASLFAWIKNLAICVKTLSSLHSRVENLERTIPKRDFDVSSKALLSGGYQDRVHAAMILRNLALQNPSEFHVDVMHLFNAALAYPLKYADSNPKSGVDPYSPDAVYIMKSIVSRTAEQMKAEEEGGYTFRLNPNSPFEYRDGCFYFEGKRLDQNP